MRKPNNYHFIIRCVCLSFLLTGTIYIAGCLATLFTVENKWTEMAIRFHLLCVFAEYVLLTIFILFFLKRDRHLRFDTKSYNFKPNRFFVLALLFSIFWIFLTDGNAITSPRYAYQNLRAGIGPIWAGMIVFSTMYFITKIVALGRLTPFSYIFFVFIGYMSGSKMVLVSTILFPIFLPQVKSKTRSLLIPLVTMLASIAFVSMFGGISFFTNTGPKLLAYFNLFELSSRVFEDISSGSMALHLGSITISSLWAAVPRALVPSKPFAFGPSYFVEYYFPGMAEARATPSFGEFTMYFADFWWFGVLISIFRTSVFLRLWAIYQLNRVSTQSWKSPFATGILLFPTMSFHIPMIICLVAYWLVSRLKFSFK